MLYRLTGLVLVLVLLASSAHAGEGRDRLDKFLHELDSLQAQFRQSVLDTENNRTGEYQGVFYLQRPGLFRWDYLAPFEQQIIGGESVVWIVDTELEQAAVYTRSVALKGTPAALLSAEKPVDDEFEVVEIGERQGLQWLELLPRDKDSDITRLLLAFDRELLLRMELVDKFGQISRFTFFDVIQNPQLDAGLFRYRPPPETDVFDY